ncbi:MAG: efflux RND transporter permease subunit, partial [Bdellovibrionota bacterium]
MMVFGYLSFSSLGVSQNPDIDYPFVNVSVTLEGASPEVMESEIVDVTENALMGVEGLIDISSTARYGSASISLEFSLDRDVDVAMQEVQSRISQVVRRYPEGTEAPVISKQNPEDQPILWLGVSGDVPFRELMTYTRDKIIPQFQLVPGVGDIFMGGFLDPEIRIWIDFKKLQQFELTVDDVISTLDNEHVEYPAGYMQKGEKEFTMRILGEAKTVKEIQNLLITKRGGGINYRPIRLSDVARIETGTEDIRRFSRVMGKTAVGIGVRKTRGVNAVEVAKAVQEKMKEMKGSLPKSYEIGVNYNGTKIIEESVHELNFELILAAALTGVVCFLFFGSWSSTLNILLAIPTSILGSFMAFKYFGFTLNTFTLLALILSVGIVVDDAIMVLENIMRHRAMKKTGPQAALDGANQITFTAVAATLSIIAIFLPVVFMEGILGRFFFQFGIVLSVAVFLSLIEALTLTPMRSAEFMGDKEEHGILDPLIEKLKKFYVITLNWALRYRWTVVILALTLFAGSFIFVKLLRKEFVPAQDQGIFIVRMQANVGSSFEYTDELVKQAEEKLKAVPGVERFFVAIGGMGGGVNSAMAFVTLKERSQRDVGQQEVMQKVRESLGGIKGFKVTIQDPSQQGFGPRSRGAIEFSVRGPEWEKLVEVTENIQAELKKDERFVDVDSNYDEGQPELKIYPDREAAARYGVSVKELGSVISALVGGRDVGKFTESGRRIDVRLRLEDEYRVTPQDILKLSVRNNRGELVSLGRLVKVEAQTTLVSITRQQRERAINIYSNIKQGASQGAMLTHIETIRASLPDGYTIVFSGSSKTFNETMRSGLFVMILGVFVAYMILASQYNSFIHPVTVLMALPFSLTGAWALLWAADSSLNIYSGIGLLLLMGLVKKNSIMLESADKIKKYGE